MTPVIEVTDLWTRFGTNVVHKDLNLTVMPGEIVSLVGTLSPDGEHLHVAISDGAGRTIGGHLLEGSLVYTTAEIAVGELDGLAFSRETDPRTTYGELVVRPRP